MALPGQMSYTGQRIKSTQTREEGESAWKRGDGIGRKGVQRGDNDVKDVSAVHRCQERRDV